MRYADHDGGQDVMRRWIIRSFFSPVGKEEVRIS